jgi:outer membrane protein OmpA-like peptidoglycan-associated protein
MFHKKHFAALVAATLAASATPSFAASLNVGPYMSLKGGFTLPEESQFDFTNNTGKMDYESNFAANGALGWSFEELPVRLEAEMGFRQMEADHWDNTPVSGDQHLYTGMMNAYVDLRDFDGFMPYAGIGLGYAMANLGDVTPVNGTDKVDDTSGSFAFQGIFGLEVPMTDQFGLLAEYRYFNATDFSYRSDANTDVDANYADHSFYVGFRYAFNAPKQSLMPEEPTTKPEPRTTVAPMPAKKQVKAMPPKPKVTMPQTYIVFFDWDKANLTADAQAIVEAAAANAQKGGLSKLVVTGHTDRSGSTAYNKRLSKKRAVSVYRALKAAGLTKAEIAVLAKGESDPLVPTNDGIREPQNRRAVITFK